MIAGFICATTDRKVERTGSFKTKAISLNDEATNSKPVGKGTTANDIVVRVGISDTTKLESSCSKSVASFSLVEYSQTLVVVK